MKNRSTFLVVLSLLLSYMPSFAGKYDSPASGRKPIHGGRAGHIVGEGSDLFEAVQASWKATERATTGLIPGTSECGEANLGAHSAIESNRYSLNLMWINQNLREDQKYIYPASDEGELQDKFLKHIFKWATASRGSTVNVWYDSELTPPLSIENTRLLIESAASSHPEWAPIRLRDVRDFPEVKANPDVFSEHLPVYFRVDLLRAIAAFHTLGSEETPYFVYGDLDMKPISKVGLFDAETAINLEKHGIVMARAGGWLGFENGFQIVSNKNPSLLEAMKFALIDLNIERGKIASRQGFFLDHGGRKGPKHNPMKPLEQIIYDSYPAMFNYYFHLCGLGIMRYYPSVMSDDYEPYNKEKHGMEPFGLGHIKISHPVFKPFDEELVKIPTKEVKLPKSHF